MRALAFWKAVTMDQSNFLEGIFHALDEAEVPFCVIGGQAVNAYVDPLVSLDLGLAVAVERFDELERALKSRFQTERFAHSLNLSQADSNLRVQIQTDPRYSDFVSRASVRDVLGLELPVASLPDILRDKILAVTDENRPSIKRQKDFLDISRILEAYPELRQHVPEAVLQRLREF